MSAEINFHKVTKVQVDMVKQYPDYQCVSFRIHCSDGKSTEITLYSESDKPIVIQIGDEE